jgi:hypothetical protein
MAVEYWIARSKRFRLKWRSNLRHVQGGGTNVGFLEDVGSWRCALEKVWSFTGSLQLTVPLASAAQLA